MCEADSVDVCRSQFFITYAKQSHLDTKYTIFGRYVIIPRSTSPSIAVHHPSTSSIGSTLSECSNPIADYRSSIFFHRRVIDGADTTLDLMERVPVTEKMRPLTEIRLERVRKVTFIFSDRN